MDWRDHQTVALSALNNAADVLEKAAASAPKWPPGHALPDLEVAEFELRVALDNTNKALYEVRAALQKNRQARDSYESDS